MPHIHEQIDFVVNAFVVYENKVLLILHKKLGCWLPLGGHIELDEEPYQALMREIFEESGLSSNQIKLVSPAPTIPTSNAMALPVPQFIDIHSVNYTHKHIALNYFVIASTNRVQLAIHEHDNIQWFSANQLDKLAPLSPEIKYYALQALKVAT